MPFNSAQAPKGEWGVLSQICASATFCAANLLTHSKHDCLRLTPMQTSDTAYTCTNSMPTILHLRNKGPSSLPITQPNYNKFLHILAHNKTGLCTYIFPIFALISKLYLLATFPPDGRERSPVDNGLGRDARPIRQQRRR